VSFLELRKERLRNEEKRGLREENKRKIISVWKQA
jgi:hypothetical protein